MTTELKTMLLYYLGELKHYQQNEHDWIIKDRITQNINALYTLLDMEGQEKTTLDTMYEIGKNQPINRHFLEFPNKK